MTQQVGRAQHGPTYNGPIYLYRLSILSGRAQQTFSRAYALLGPAIDTPLSCTIDYPHMLTNPSPDHTFSFIELKL